MKEIDEKFDKAEKIVDRLGKLILKIVTGLVALTIAILMAIDQIEEHLLEDSNESSLENLNIDTVDFSKTFLTSLSLNDTIYNINDTNNLFSLILPEKKEITGRTNTTSSERIRQTLAIEANTIILDTINTQTSDTILNDSIIINNNDSIIVDTVSNIN